MAELVEKRMGVRKSCERAECELHMPLDAFAACVEVLGTPQLKVSAKAWCVDHPHVDSSLEISWKGLVGVGASGDEIVLVFLKTNCASAVWAICVSHEPSAERKVRLLRMSNRHKVNFLLHRLQL